VPVTILEDSKDIKYADFVDVYKARHLSIMVEPFDALKITKLLYNFLSHIYQVLKTIK
jgi:hypothetical protein